MDFFIAVTALMMIMAAASTGIVILVRDLREVPVQAGAAFGVGAYCATAALNQISTDVLVAVAFGAGAGAAFVALCGWLVRGLSSNRELVALLAVQVAFDVGARSLIPLTGGSEGVDVNRSLTLSGIGVRVELLPQVAIALGCVVFLFGWAVQDRFGARASIVGVGVQHAFGLGLQANRLHTVLHALAGISLGAAGALYAIHVGFVSPTAFGFDQSIWLLVIAMFAQRSPFTGILVGTAAVILTFEALRFVGLSASMAAQLKQAAAGVILAALIVIVGRRMSLKDR